jgi:hypothetical protein
LVNEEKLMTTKAIDRFRSHRWLATGLAVLFCMAMTPLSEAADLCFLTLGNGVEFQFKTTMARLKAPGEKSLNGRMFGVTLADCAGLKQWPVTGTAMTTSTGLITLGFSAATVDAASCGAVDFIVTLDPRSLSGSLQLRNEHNNFSTTSTFTPVACAPQPSADGPSPLIAGEDAIGNIAH